MTLNKDPNNSSVIHIIGGTDPQLLSLHEKLESSGLNTLALTEDQSFRNLLTTLEDVRPRSGFDEIYFMDLESQVTRRSVEKRLRSKV